MLIDAASGHEGIELLFEHTVRDVDLEQGNLIASRPGGGEVTVEGDFVVGADGAFSAVRARMQRLDRFQYSQDYLPLGYKELSIPAGEGGAFRIEREALHIWPRGNSMMIALPNADGSFTCTLFWPFEGKAGFTLPEQPDAIREHFGTHFADAVPLMPELVEDYLRNPTSSLVTVRCSPWHVGGRVVLLGDAAHAVVPFYGQGANASFEDCVVLDACLREASGDLGQAFGEYSRRRKRHADAIADLAIENFHVMSDRVSSPLFQLGKRGEALAERMLPFWFIPLYTMISFSLIPYDDARRRASAQRRQLRLGVLFVVVVVLGILGLLLLPGG
ncbi:MAG: FAD-dependent monooxygenase [Acidobacteriota bacterium]|nr:FAD-dependent monooxygenase [Acidobacteriota bacterium]